MEEFLCQQLGEDGWYQPVKGVLTAMGDAALKGTLAEAVARGVPVSSLLVWGALTYASFHTGATTLNRLLHVLTQATGEISLQKEMAVLIDQVGEDMRVAMPDAVRSVMEPASERIGTIAGQSEERRRLPVPLPTARVRQRSPLPSGRALLPTLYATRRPSTRWLHATRRSRRPSASSAGWARRGERGGASGSAASLRLGHRHRRRPRKQPPLRRLPDTPTSYDCSKALLDDAIITQGEFDTKKRQLLGL